MVGLLCLSEKRKLKTVIKTIKLYSKQFSIMLITPVREPKITYINFFIKTYQSLVLHTDTRSPRRNTRTDPTVMSGSPTNLQIVQPHQFSTHSIYLRTLHIVSVKKNHCSAIRLSLINRNFKVNPLVVFMYSFQNCLKYLYKILNSLYY